MEGALDRMGRETLFVQVVVDRDLNEVKTHANDEEEHSVLKEGWGRISEGLLC